MKQIKIIFLIIGTIIGAGFVSGKEIGSFFSIFGYYSFIFIFLIFLLLYFSINKLLKIGSVNKINNASDLNTIIFKKDNLIIKAFTFIAFVILSSTMFSAIPSAFNFSTFTIEHFITIVATTIIVCITINKDDSFIKTLCTLIVPIIIILMVAVCLININDTTNISTGNFVLLPYNAICYVCRNIFLSYFVIAKSSYGLTSKQCKQISFFTSLILCCLMAVVIFVELGNPEILSSSMPLLSLAEKSGILYYIYLIVMQLAVFTTLISSLVTLKSFFHFKCKILNIIVPTLICASLSFISFDYFIIYLYPVIGMLGLYLIFYLAFPNFFLQNTNEKVHNTSKKT